MGRIENINIFKDTQKLYKTNEILKNSIKNSKEKTEIYLENDELKINSNTSYDTIIEISKDRSYEVARKLIKEGYISVCVHNFASATNPGGGVVNGSSAQEECLCRCSTLYETLITDDCIKKFYNPHRHQNAIHNDDCIYTPGISVFKTDTMMPKLMDTKDWYNVNVITCAAPNLRDNPKNKWNKNEKDEKITLTDKELLDIHKKRLQRIIDIAYKNGNECLVIGAFGCGAFKNNPRIVARATKEILENNTGKFKKIVLAIYCSPKDDSNYKIFNELISTSPH